MHVAPQQPYAAPQHTVTPGSAQSDSSLQKCRVVPMLLRPIVQNLRLMNHLVKIAQSGTPGTGLQFRRTSYGSNGIRSFLRDVIALANASVDGPRYIVVGTEIDANGDRKIREVSQDDFNGKPSYQSIIADFVEPPIRVKYQPVTISGKRIGIFEIGDCQDRPYMMRVDHSANLRRGDAYTRIQKTPVKMGRRQLQVLFEKKFRESVSADSIEIGFPGEIIHKQYKVETIDLEKMPSIIAAAKIKQLLDIRESSKYSGSTTVMTRMVHARLFGSDTPYEERSPDELMREIADIATKHKADDQQFLFEENAKQIQVVIYNQGDEAIRDASLSLALPNHNAFYVANRLPKLSRNGKLVERSADEQSEYPSVSLKDDLVKVSNKLGEIPTDTIVPAFRIPLRICAGSDLSGRRVGVQYTLFGQNLRRPVTGRLHLLL